jgi:hypothetical protein
MLSSMQERARSRSHVIRMAIRREAVLDVLEGIDRKMNAYGHAWDA